MFIKSIKKCMMDNSTLNINKHWTHHHDKSICRRTQKNTVTNCLLLLARAAYYAASKHLSTIFWAWNSLIGGWAFNETHRLLQIDWCECSQIALAYGFFTVVVTSLIPFNRIGLSIWVVYCNAHPFRQGNICETIFVALGEQARNLLDWRYMW